MVMEKAYKVSLIVNFVYLFATVSLLNLSYELREVKNYYGRQNSWFCFTQPVRKISQ